MMRKILILSMTMVCVVLSPFTSKIFLQASNADPFEIRVIPKGDLIQGRKGIVEIMVKNTSSKIIALLSMDFENIQTDGGSIDLYRIRRRSYIDTRGDTIYYIPGFSYDPENDVINSNRTRAVSVRLRDFEIISLFQPGSAGQKEMKIRPIHGGLTEEKLILKYTTLDKKELARYFYAEMKDERRLWWAPFKGRIDTLTVPNSLSKSYFFKADAIRSVKKFVHSLTLPILYQYFTLEEAFKTVGFETDNHTYSESESCWILFQDGYTYWVSPAKTRKIRGDYIDIVNGVEFSSGSHIRIKYPFTTDVEGRDRRYRENPEVQERALQFIHFLSHLAPESFLGMVMESRNIPKAQLFPVLNEAEKLGIRITGNGALRVHFLD